MTLPHVNAVSLLTVNAAQNKNLCDRKQLRKPTKNTHKKLVERGGVRLFFLGVLVFLFLFFCFFHFRPHSGVNVRTSDETVCCIALTFFLFYDVFSRHLSGRLWWHVKCTYQSQPLWTHTMDVTQHMDGYEGYLMHCSSQPIQPDPGRYGVTFQ